MRFLTVVSPVRVDRLDRPGALLWMAIQTGLRLSELTSLNRDAVVFGVGAHVRCLGKGRKER